MRLGYLLKRRFAPGIIDDDHLSAGDCFHGMEGIGGNDAHETGCVALGDAVNGDFELALQDFINFFLGMRMFVNGRALVELIMREGHAGGVEIAASPAGQALDFG